MSDYFRWKTNEDASFYLELANSDGTGRTGESPRISIRRNRNLNGTLLDNFYWDASGSFTGAVNFWDMVEVDATGSPGLYSYHFSQSMVQEPYVYNVYFTSMKLILDGTQIVQFEELYYKLIIVSNRISNRFFLVQDLMRKFYLLCKLCNTLIEHIILGKSYQNQIYNG